jgi:hypothetical protein
MKKSYIIILFLVLSFVGTTTLPPKASAQGLPFGGLVSYSLPCTCSGNMWVWFTPLYLGGLVVATGPVVYSPFSTLLYPYFMIGVPGTWHLGSYIPGAQSCWMIVPPPGVGCVPLPALGVMTKVGTNRLF